MSPPEKVKNAKILEDYKRALIDGLAKQKTLVRSIRGEGLEELIASIDKMGGIVTAVLDEETARLRGKKEGAAENDFKENPEWKDLVSEIKTLAPEERKALGQFLNSEWNEVNAAFEDGIIDQTTYEHLLSEQN